MMLELHQLPYYLAGHLDVLWTFMLLSTRFMGLILSLPGIGAGSAGARVRIPATLAFGAAACVSSPPAVLPDNLVMMGLSLLSEFALGFIVGIIPALLVAAVEMGVQLSSSTMGLGGSAIFDPSTGGSISSLSKLHGDLTTLVFLGMGVHYGIFEAMAGLSETVVPGTFAVDGATLDLVLDRMGGIFRTGMMVSAPVIVALMMTQFVMGLISRAVPSVNIFVISFPLTVGIGFILSALALPEVVRLVSQEMTGIENSVSAVLEDATPANPSTTSPSGRQHFDAQSMEIQPPRSIPEK